MWMHKLTFQFLQRHDSTSQVANYQSFPGTDNSELSVTPVATFLTV